MKKNTNLTATVERHLALYRAQVYEKYFPAGIEDQYLISQLKPSNPGILVIEDNADDWFLLRWAFLQQFPETKIDWIPTPGQVITYLDSCLRLEQGLPRLIVLDLYLPTAQAGFYLLRTLKSHCQYQQIPIVIISRSNDPNDIAESVRYNSTAYLVKPASYGQWVETMEELGQYWDAPTIR